MKIDTNSLRINRINVNGTELVYICRQLSETHPKITIYYNLLKTLPKDIFYDIWSTPESYLWSKLTWDLIHINKQESKLLDNYLNWSYNSADEQLAIQIDQLALFVLSGYILLDQEIEFPEYIKIPRAGSFPGTGISWHLRLRGQIQIKGYKNKGLIVRRWLSPRHADKRGHWDDMNHSWLEKFDQKIDDYKYISFRQPKIDGHEMTIDIWSECARMNFEGMEWIDRINDYDKINKFKLTAEQAMNQIKEYDDGIYQELRLLISKIVPLEVISDANPSSSNSTILGIVFCTYTEDPLLFAEMLIHEFSHNKLFLFQEVDPLLDSEKHGDGWSNQSYYSPWRSDPRPLNGILHGLYVFTQVTDFWNYIRSQFTEKDYEHISFRRFYLLVEQLKIAVDILKNNSTFTEVGKQLIKDIDGKIRSFDSKVSKNDLESTSAYFSELDFDRDLVGNNIIDAIRLHRQKWDVLSNV